MNWGQAYRVRCQRYSLLLLGSLLLAACSRHADQSLAQPVDATRDTVCSLDGMTLADFPGPKAQVIYQGQSNPVYFCNTLELLATYLHPEQQRPVSAMYVQDMGATDWQHPQGHWIDAHGAYFVIGSRKMGSMGPTLATFSKEGQAQTFVSQNGGHVLKFNQITPDMVSLDGGVLKDRLEQ